MIFCVTFSIRNIIDVPPDHVMMAGLVDTNVHIQDPGRGDWEGFFAAFINNLVQLLILAPLCMVVLGFSPKLIFGTILPGVAISFLVGNLFYAWQALKLAQKEGKGLFKRYCKES